MSDGTKDEKSTNVDATQSQPAYCKTDVSCNNHSEELSTYQIDVVDESSGFSRTKQFLQASGIRLYQWIKLENGTKKAVAYNINPQDLVDLLEKEFVKGNPVVSSEQCHNIHFLPRTA